MLREAVAFGREILFPQPIGDDQIQPLSNSSEAAFGAP
jgi:hypothetical protein